MKLKNKVTIIFGSIISILLVVNASFIIYGSVLHLSVLMAHVTLSILIGFLALAILLHVFIFRRLTSTYNMIIKASIDKKLKILGPRKDRDEIDQLTYSLVYMLDGMAEREHFQDMLSNASRLAAIGEMSAHIAHEIKNPLTVIIGYTDTLKEKLEAETIDREGMRGLLGKIENMTDRITKIINGLKRSVKEIHGNKIEKIVIKDLLEDAISVCQMRLKKGNVQFELMNPYPEMKIEGDRVQLSQVIINLIANSIDAIEKLPEKWILIEVEDREQAEDYAEGMLPVRIRFTDSGKGIPPEIVENMFKQCFTTKEQGTGIGLNISSTIISKHSGIIRVDTNAPNTSFVIELHKKYTPPPVEAQ